MPLTHFQTNLALQDLERAIQDQEEAGLELVSLSRDIADGEHTNILTFTTRSAPLSGPCKLFAGKPGMTEQEEQDFVQGILATDFYLISYGDVFIQGASVPVIAARHQTMPIPPPTPETVQTFIASIASALAATKTWLELRDRRAAKQSANTAQSQALSDPATIENAMRLLSIVPPETLQKMMERYKRCYEKFNKMMDDEEGTFEGDVDKAAQNALPNCVCRALSTIRAVTGGFPDPAFDRAWDTYRCDVRLNDDSE